MATGSSLTQNYSRSQKTKNAPIKGEIIRITDFELQYNFMSVNKDIVTVQAVAETSLNSENSKLRQTDAVEYFKTLLKRNNLITSKCSSSISHEAMLMGEEL
ncbi:UNVERIFIED_CONTAM: hypothetical protein NCL1_21863 [Trichonephila clavipes]